MNAIAYELPFPPSVNTYWRTFRGRMIISAKGRKYRESVVACVGLTKPLDCRLRITVQMHAPDKRRRDVDNILKAPLDALRHAGVYLDDSQIDDLRVIRAENRKDGAIEVVINPLS